jgi:hypothetical protein
MTEEERFSTIKITKKTKNADSLIRDIGVLLSELNLGGHTGWIMVLLLLLSVVLWGLLFVL